MSVSCFAAFYCFLGIYMLFEYKSGFGVPLESNPIFAVMVILTTIVIGPAICLVYYPMILFRMFKREIINYKDIVILLMGFLSFVFIIYNIIIMSCKVDSYFGPILYSYTVFCCALGVSLYYAYRILRGGA